MRISARVDYAVRAVLELADGGDPVGAEAVSAVQEIPHKFLAGVTLADIAHDQLADAVGELAADPAAWRNP
ncbi:hypothetical protein V2W30_12615 [Streptomyces sp. Q6]|uniref:Uncharacterized protein n=1 Tax=Streptomyces citrinus TaxID=3118173 RepID=A0ACD5AAB6_9ACTN